MGSLLAIALIAAAGWVINELTSDSRRLTRLLAGVDRTPIEQVRDGDHVKIVGRVVLGERSVRAPLTGRRCAYFDAEVGDLHEQLVSESGGVDFFIEDETGRALVELENATVMVVLDAEVTTGGRRAPGPELQRFLDRHGVDRRRRAQPFRRAGYQLLVFREGAIEPGELVAVTGTCMLEPDPDPRAQRGYRESPMRTVVRASPNVPLLVSDDPATL